MFHGVAYDIIKCARCGGDHHGVTYQPLANSPFSWEWCMCPKTQQPIFFVVVDDDLQKRQEHVRRFAQMLDVEVQFPESGPV